MRQINPIGAQNERSDRLAALSDREQAAFKWLYEGYSEAWTTETLGMKKSDAKKLFKSIYQKLGVDNRRGIIKYYASKNVELI